MAQSSSNLSGANNTDTKMETGGLSGVSLGKGKEEAKFLKGCSKQTAPCDMLVMEPMGGDGTRVEMGGAGRIEKRKTKVLVVMGATGSGKSRLAIDLAIHFPLEVVSADSMQVYCGLDVLTNKVPLVDRHGVPHHLLGFVDPNVEFTSRDFRDLAVPLIDDISSRGCLPIIVGGTNYYIQALVSPFLVDDLVEDMGECSLSLSEESLKDKLKSLGRDHDLHDAFNCLKKIDPNAANRIHPNDHRKIDRYLDLYENSGFLPSELFQGKASEKWGRPDDFRYDCCFIWVDASLSELDLYVEQRVDSMMDAGLLDEVYDIYDPSVEYTRGLRQAIGVREFGKLFSNLFSSANKSQQHTADEGIDFPGTGIAGVMMSNQSDQFLRANQLRSLILGHGDLSFSVNEAIGELKANTRRLVRRQRRRLNRLKTVFGWNLHYIDATEAFRRRTEDSWQREVVDPCISIIEEFLSEDLGDSADSSKPNEAAIGNLASRDLWTQYVCEACGNKILRGAHEWEQHKKGRVHRKRLDRLKKAVNEARLCTADSAARA